MGNTNDVAMDLLLDNIQLDSLEEQLAEQEVALGQARLERDYERVSGIEDKIAKIKAEINQTSKIDDNYPEQLKEAALQGLAGEIISVIEPNSEADPAALLMNLLTAFGNVIGKDAWFSVGTDKHYFNLFCVFVGESSKGRKGTSWSPILTLFEDIDAEWADNRIQSGLSSGEGLICNVSNEVNKNGTLMDQGMNDKRLLIMEGEFAQTLKVLRREGNTLSPILRNAWDSANLQILTKNFPMRAKGAHISTISHITKQELVKSLNEIETGNGFANRFLWFSVNRSKCLPFGGEYDENEYESLRTKLKEAIDFAKGAGELKWAAETRDLWASIYPELSEGKPGLIGAITARAEAQVTRLSCIYSLINCSNEIRIEHLKAALAVWSYAEDSVKYIFQKSTGDPLADRIRVILETCPNGMTKTQISNALGRHYKSVMLNEALDALLSSGIAIMRKVSSGGRTAERWMLVNN